MGLGLGVEMDGKVDCSRGPRFGAGTGREIGAGGLP